MELRSSAKVWRRSVGWSGGAAVVAGLLGPPAFILSGCQPSTDAGPLTLLANMLSAMLFAILGGLILTHRPGHAIGALCAWIGMGNTAFILGYFFVIPCATASGIDAVEIAVLSWLLYSFGIVPVVLPLFILMPFLYPNGRFLSPGWRRFVIGAISITFGASLALGVQPDLSRPNALGARFAIGNPFGLSPLPDWWYSLFYSVASVSAIGLSMAGIGSMIVRFRRSRGDERQQVKWLAYFLSTAVFAQLIIFELPGALFAPQIFQTIWYELIIAVVMLGLPLIIGIAVFKYRLYAIDIVINRTVVYGSMTLMVVLTYVAIVGLLGALFHTGSNLMISLAATGVVAVIFQPLRELLQRGVNRYLFGQRDEPYAVLSQLSQRLEETVIPGEALTAMVETISTALKLPAVTIELVEHDRVIGRAAVGASTGEDAVFPLRYQNETVGRLIVSPRAKGERFVGQEQRLLTDIAGHAGAVASATRLTMALQRSREGLVLAREEERRRIRRDLHDGLGPTLASQMLKLEALLDLVDNERPEVAIQLSKLVEQTQRMVVEIRRLVYELRPPTLDELGLTGALRAHVAQMQGVRQAVEISLTTQPAQLPRLSAACEVAAYRIVLEAVTNVIRHAHATVCSIELSVELESRPDHLLVRISDDGIGLLAQTGSGIGLVSMRERAEELGGTCSIESIDGGGCRVTARLPLRQEIAQ
jgi:signal transduction histidine kinase